MLFAAVLAATFAHPSHAIDVAVTRWLQRAAPAPDFPAAILVFLGDAEVLIPLAAAAGLVLWSRHRTRAHELLGLALGLLAVSAIAFALKHLIPHPGPPAEFERHVFRPGVSIPQPYSFPSGHTTRAVYLATTLFCRRAVLGVGLVLAMMTALVYLGDHWMTDVLGGLCLGYACAQAARGLMPARSPSRPQG